MALLEDRRSHSKSRLEELGKALRDVKQPTEDETLTIYAAGSYARYEASEYSDIDLFFLAKGDESQFDEPRTHKFRLFADVIQAGDRLRFPKFSNDCEYLQIIYLDDVLKSIGRREDDGKNYFTARMLMLLEGRCLYGDIAFNEILDKIVAAYFRNYEEHKDKFRPVFLLNDIHRYWKTLLLNYESLRNATGENSLKPEDIQRRVKKFKVKYSRVLTCFASLAYLGIVGVPISPDDVKSMVAMTPQDRLNHVRKNEPACEHLIEEIIEDYIWFLRLTGLPQSDLEEKFRDHGERRELYNRADAFGDLMYRLILEIDQIHPDLQLARTLVV